MPDLDRIAVFSKKLHELASAKGWHQSEIARQADLPRDSISVYWRGKSLPTDKSAKKLANAFGISVDELMPRGAVGLPSDVEVEVDEAKPNYVTLKIHQRVPLSVARQILEILDSAGSET